MLRAWLDLPANSTKEKEGKEGREGERGGDKRHSGRRLRGVSGVYDRSPGSYRPREGPENRAFDKTIVYRRGRGKKEKEEDGEKRETEAGFLYPRNAPRIRMATVGGA